MQKVTLENKFFLGKDFTTFVRLIFYKATETDLYYALEIEEEVPYKYRTEAKYFKEKIVKYYQGASTAFQIYTYVCDYYNRLIGKGKQDEEVKHLKEKCKTYNGAKSISKEKIDNV